MGDVQTFMKLYSCNHRGVYHYMHQPHKVIDWYALYAGLKIVFFAGEMSLVDLPSQIGIISS